MATRGRKPKPPELKILHGDRADRLNPAAPEAIPGRPVCPDHVAGDPIARAKWDDLVEQLEQIGVLSRTDGEAIALYASTFALWHMARHQLKDAASLTVSTATGGEKASPLLPVVSANAGLLARLLAEFGLTPSSRSRVHAMEKKGDELDQFLSGKAL